MHKKMTISQQVTILYKHAGQGCSSISTFLYIVTLLTVFNIVVNGT